MEHSACGRVRRPSLANGEEVGSANHDEDGWKGMETVEDLVKAIGRVLDIPVEEEESDENEEAEG